MKVNDKNFLFFYSSKIEIESDYFFGKEKLYTLRPDGLYLADRRVIACALDMQLKRNLTNKLQEDAYEILRVNVEVEIRKIDYCSATIFFVVSDWSDSDDGKCKKYGQSFELIRRHSEEIMKCILMKEFKGRAFRVSTTLDIPEAADCKNVCYKLERKYLKVTATYVFIILGVIIAVTGLVLGFRDRLSVNLIGCCITAGILGSTSSALLSALDRKANGWESEDGKKHPVDGKADRFSQRMATFFLYRPVFGVIAGLLVFFGIQTDYFGDLNTNESGKTIFYSLLSGLFVKSLIEKLKDSFDNLVGSKK